MTKTFFFAVKFCFLQNEWWKWTFWEQIYYPSKLADVELLQSPTHFESTDRKSTLLTNEEVHNSLRSQQQANRQSRKQLFQMNCSIINLWNKQTDSWGETSFGENIKNLLQVKSKKTMRRKQYEENKVWCKCLL